LVVEKSSCGEQLHAGIGQGVGNIAPKIDSALRVRQFGQQHESLQIGAQIEQVRG